MYKILGVETLTNFDIKLLARLGDFATIASENFPFEQKYQEYLAIYS
jgi:hypothetical protein